MKFPFVTMMMQCLNSAPAEYFAFRGHGFSLLTENRRCGVFRLVLFPQESTYSASAGSSALIIDKGKAMDSNVTQDFFTLEQKFTQAIAECNEF
ncbi:hypothetical protein [Lentibacillus sp. Marseille-P4043]|uniref:hypothetical protein n=1 Tax=Lentibacillus sp. Marseille-P4043 TaxID=2040293 RepID=UPI00131A5487|nr:hypothetical protein [Lentibacillus sp. Marseille-P4043]